MKKAISLLLVLGAYLYLVGKFFNFYMADMYFASSKNLLTQGQLKQSADHIIKAVRFNQYEPAYRRQKAKVLLATTILQDQEDVKGTVLKELLTAQELNPKNLATLRNVVPLYYLLAMKADGIDQEYVSVAQNYYRSLKNTYPNDLGVFSEVGASEKKLGLTDDYSYTYEQAMKMRQDLVSWHEAFE